MVCRRVQGTIKTKALIGYPFMYSLAPIAYKDRLSGSSRSKGKGGNMMFDHDA